MEPQRRELRWFYDNINLLSQKYGGRQLVIKNQTVIGDYSSFPDACDNTLEHHKLGTFIIQECPKAGESNAKASLTNFVAKH